MKFALRALDFVVVLLAALAGALIVLFTVGIVYDVIVRTLGFAPPRYTTSAIEYGILYMTFFSAPWILHKKGHVYVETMTSAFSEKSRNYIQTFSYILCIGVCVCLFYFSLDLTIKSYLSGEFDLRSFNMPRWLVYLPMPISFLLLAAEFVRFMFGSDSLYSAPDDGAEGL